MTFFKISLFCLLAAFTSYADQGISSEEIKSRLAELSELSVRSVSGRFIVVGTNRVESFALGSWCENAVKQVEHITGLPVSFNNYWITLVVDEDNHEIPDGAIVRYSMSSKKQISRVYLKNYAHAYERAGRQAICCSILAAYNGVFSDNQFSLPAWLWMGMEQNLLLDIRTHNMEKVLLDYHQGKHISVRSIIESVNGDDTGVGEDAINDKNRLAIYSVLVRWLSSRSNRKEIFQTLFSSADYITVNGLEDLMSGRDSGMLLDEIWDRWLLKQSHVVRSYALVSVRKIEQLRSELLLYAGTYGIPLGVEIPRGAALVTLIRFRGEEWLPQYVNRKRGRLNLIAAGQKNDLAHVVGLYDDFLSGLEKDESDILLLKQWRNANEALNRLAAEVKEQ